MFKPFAPQLVIALSLLPILWGCDSWAQTAAPLDFQPQNLPIAAKIVVHNTTINLEVAQSSREQEIGLMFRTSMPTDHGMVFPFSRPQPAQFWMKNTLIPLDMLFLYQGQIRNIQTQVPPCKADPCPGYGPGADVLIDQVIELNAGRAATLGLKVGDKLVVQPLSMSKK